MIFIDIPIAADSKERLETSDALNVSIWKWEQNLLALLAIRHSLFQKCGLCLESTKPCPISNTLPRYCNHECLASGTPWSDVIAALDEVLVRMKTAIEALMTLMDSSSCQRLSITERLLFLASEAKLRIGGS